MLPYVRESGVKPVPFGGKDFMYGTYFVGEHASAHAHYLSLSLSSFVRRGRSLEWQCLPVVRPRSFFS
jgi:hypothetical protein